MEKEKKAAFCTQIKPKKRSRIPTRAPCHDRLYDANEQENDDHAANQANNNTRQLKNQPAGPQ